MTHQTPLLLSTSNMTAQHYRDASEADPGYTLRITYFSLFGVYALIGGYFLYCSTLPWPLDSDPALLWPYLTILLALAIAATNCLLCFKLSKRCDKEQAGSIGLAMCLPHIATGFLHLFTWAGYKYAYGSDGHAYPNFAVCWVALGACIDAVLSLVILPAESEPGPAREV